MEMNVEEAERSNETEIELTKPFDTELHDKQLSDLIN